MSTKKVEHRRKMPLQAEDIAKSFVVCTLDAISQPMSLDHIKQSIGRLANEKRLDGVKLLACSAENVEEAVRVLAYDGKIVQVEYDRFTSRKHCPRFRTLDADWQW